MKAALISLESKSSQWTGEAMKKYFHRVDELNLKEIEINFSGKNSEVLYEGKPIEKYDCIFAKGSFRYAPLLRSLTSLLKVKSYLPIVASAFTIGHDKLLTQLKLQQKNIPMPRTYLSATIDAAKKILEKTNYPTIMKFPQGTQGKGIMFADSYASASSMLDALSALNQPFLIQEYVETGGTDIRAIVVGDKVVASMKRKADIKEVRANVHAGGIGEATQLDSYTKKVAVDAAKAIGAEICGVDMLETPKGPVVIEVNMSPGLQGITEATKIDVADKIAKHLYKRTVEETEEEKVNGAAKIMKDLEIEKGKEIISSLDFRGTRILLPEIITKVAKFNENEDVEISAEEDKIVIKKFKVS
ncbi:MAG: RimK family alpha-L-glutamate ligase [DPANN group archaeon]|nr:RimK family alpha-L-glutamate ligase [DPANN group archaeon]